MKIVDAKTFVVGAAWRNLIFIRLDTDEGISGCAEATAHNKTQAMLGYLQEAFRRYAIGIYSVDRAPQYGDRSYQHDADWHTQTRRRRHQ